MSGSIEEQFVKLLADGMHHPRQEFLDIVKPSGVHAVRMQISRIRKKLPSGQDIICEYRNRRFGYRRIRHLASPNTGVT